MRIAVTIEEDAVATVFDFCSKLALVNMEKNDAVQRQVVDFCEKLSSLRAAQLKDLLIDTLICGAISESAAMMVQHSGIKLISGITGNIDCVLEAYSKGCLQQARYLLPGFGGARAKKTKG